MAHGEQVSFADDAGDLVSVIVDGYEQIPDTDAGHDDALFLRVCALADVGNAIQGAIIEHAVETGSFDPAMQSEDVLTTLGQDRRIPFSGVTSGAGTSVDWTHRVPLVVMRTDYEPFSGRTAPTGNVVVLDPSTEVTFLTSLAQLGLAPLLTAGPG
ncbi:MAG: hypothetical protein WCG47_25705 [Dermatophilaceae bacterium]